MILLRIKKVDDYCVTFLRVIKTSVQKVTYSWLRHTQRVYIYRDLITDPGTLKTALNKSIIQLIKRRLSYFSVQKRTRPFSGYKRSVVTQNLVF